MSREAVCILTVLLLLSGTLVIVPTASAQTVSESVENEPASVGGGADIP